MGRIRTGKPKGRPRNDFLPAQKSSPIPARLEMPAEWESPRAIVSASSCIRTIPDAVDTLLELSSATKAHWDKLTDVSMYFIEKALALAHQVEKPAEAFFCAEKAMVLREKYDALKDRIDNTLDNSHMIVEYSSVNEVCKSPQLTVLDGKSEASA